MTEYIENDVLYYAYNNEYVIVGKDSNSDINFITASATKNPNQIVSLIIPEYFNNLPVKGFANGAFSRCYELTKVIILANIEEITYRCFADCCNLKYLEIPSSVKSIDKLAIHYFNVSSDNRQAQMHAYVVFQSDSQLEKIDNDNFDFVDKLTIIFESRVNIHTNSILYELTNKVYLFCNKPMKLGKLSSITFDPCSLNCQINAIYYIRYALALQILITL